MVISYTCSQPLPYRACSDPESGTDHSLKEVSAYIIWYSVHTWDLQGSCHKDVCAVFDIIKKSYILLLTIVKRICVMDSSPEGTCVIIERPHQEL